MCKSCPSHLLLCCPDCGRSTEQAPCTLSCGLVAAHAHLLLDWGLQELDAELQAEAAAQPKCFVAQGMDTAVQALQAEQKTQR